MNRANVFFMVVILNLFVGVTLCYSHHAMEYIEMESYRTALKGEFVFHIHFDYMVEDKNDSTLDHWEFTPGLSYGVTNRLMFDIHTHFAKFGSGHIVNGQQSPFGTDGPPPFMEAIAVSMQYRLTEGTFIDVAAAVLYEIPFSRSKKLLDGRQVIEGRLILSKDFAAHSNICANLVYGKDGDETFENWALGVRVPLSGNPHGIAAGVEFLGDFEDEFSVVTGIYIPLGTGNTVFKVGLQFSKHIGASRINTTLMHRY